MAAVAVAGAAAVTGCDADVLDTDVALDQQSYHADFGDQSGSIPDVTCDPAAPGVCGGDATVRFATSAGDAQLAFGCDDTTARCYASADARVAHAVAVLQDQNFTSKVERQAVILVRSADVAYTIPVNTLTFDLPGIDLYVGPEGTTRETDANVFLVDHIPPVAAGATVAEGSGHVVLRDGTPARNLVEQHVQERRPFVFVVAFAPRIEAGTPVPSGAIDVVLAPRLRLGLPR